MVDLLRDVERYVLQGLPVQDGLVQDRPLLAVA